MRRDFDDQLPLFHVFEGEDRIPVGHPLRDIKGRADRILDSLNAKFAAAYSSTGVMTQWRAFVVNQRKLGVTAPKLVSIDLQPYLST